METYDRYLAVHNLSVLQRQAGVEPAVAELVVAFARLLVDAGEPLTFDPRPFAPGSAAALRLAELQQLNPEVDVRFLAFLAAYSTRMCERGHACIASLDDLARQLGHPLDDLHSIAAHASRYYRRILLPRSNGSHRRIDSPRDPIRSMQRWILRHVLTSYRPHDSVHGFVRGRSIVTNAALHVGHATVVTVDLADFFPGIRYQQVRKGFEKLGYPYSVARLLASLCTKDGALPQGAPTSPALSNLVCERLDRRLSGLARARGFQYTRYADDMSFSSDHKRLPTILPVVAQIIGEEGFTIRTEKTRVARKGARRSVTGVVVNERLNLPRAHVRRLRAAAHYYVHKGDRAIVLGSRTRPDSDPRAVLAGHLAFLSMVNALRGNALRRIVSSA